MERSEPHEQELQLTAVPVAEMFSERYDDWDVSLNALFGLKVEHWSLLCLKLDLWQKFDCERDSVAFLLFVNKVCWTVSVGRLRVSWNAGVSYVLAEVVDGVRGRGTTCPSCLIDPSVHGNMYFFPPQVWTCASRDF